MTPAIPDYATRTLLDMALRNQGDILGYRDFGGPETGDGEEVCESDQVAFLEELATDALRGDQESVRLRVLSWPTLRRMDPVTAALLMYMGIDAACALALHDALGKSDHGLEIVDADEEHGHRIVEANAVGWIVTLPGGVVWNSIGLLRLPAMPDTVGASMAGEPLHRLLSHPALDGWKLIVRQISADGDDAIVHLTHIPLPDHGVRELEALRRENLKKAA